MAAQPYAVRQYPGTASALAIAGGAMMIASSLIILAISFIFIPAMGNFIFGHNPQFITQGNVTTAIINNHTYTYTGSYRGINGTFPFPPSAIPGFISRIMGFVGGLGLISGIIVLVSGLMLHYGKENQRTLWGVLVVIFSVLSFFGFGGFIIGAILGIVGGIMALTWKPSVPPPAPPATTTT